MKRHWAGICAVGILVCGLWAASNSRAQSQGATQGGNNRARKLAARSFVLTCPVQDYTLQDFDSGSKSVSSPDGRKRAVLAKDGLLHILNGDRRIGTVDLPEISADLSIVWSPDSKKLGVTYSDGGAAGGFHGHVYGLSGNGFVELPKPVEVAFDDFKKDRYCQSRGDNEYVLGWPEGSKAVFVVVEVYPTSDCGPDAGTMLGYLMGLDGNILHRYSTAVAQRVTDSCEKSGRALVR